MALASIQGEPENHGSDHGKVPVGALIPQPHGGALRNGGTNAGGPGRPKDRVRAALELVFENKGVKRLTKLVEDENPDIAIKAIRAVGDYSIGQKQELTLANPEALERAVRAIVPWLDENVGREKADECLAILKAAFGE